MANSAFKRILLKVSGEVLAGDQSFGIEPEYLKATAQQIADAARSGVQIAIVPGGGNWDFCLAGTSFSSGDWHAFISSMPVNKNRIRGIRYLMCQRVLISVQISGYLDSAMRKAVVHAQVAG